MNDAKHDDYVPPTVTDLGRLEEITRTAGASGPNEHASNKT
jgi:hypothetical protein